MTLRFRFLAFAALAGCSGTPAEPPEAGLYDARDVIVDPRDGGLDAAAPDADDVQPTVDVVIFDAPATDSPAPTDAVFPVDAAPPADAAADIGPPPDSSTRPDAPSPDLIEPADAPLSPCADLAERYAAAVREGQSCAAAAGCEARVCETLCCACEVFITGSPERMRQLDDLRGRAAALDCLPTLRCPTTRCPPARSGACSADGRCVTLRDSLVDAGAPPPDAPPADTPRG